MPRIKIGGKFKFANLPKEHQEDIKKKLALKHKDKLGKYYKDISKPTKNEILSTLCPGGWKELKPGESMNPKKANKAVLKDVVMNKKPANKKKVKTK